LRVDKIGNSGSYINLKTGELITNNGTFRGKLVAEELSVEKDITLGNLETGEYITLGPNGVSLGTTVIVNAVGPEGGGGGYVSDNIAAVKISFTEEIESSKDAHFGTNFASKIKSLITSEGVTSKSGSFVSLNVQDDIKLNDIVFAERNTSDEWTFTFFGTLDCDSDLTFSDQFVTTLKDELGIEEGD
jgi:hypothetical protein